MVVLNWPIATETGMQMKDVSLLSCFVLGVLGANVVGGLNGTGKLGAIYIFTQVGNHLLVLLAFGYATCNILHISM